MAIKTNRKEDLSKVRILELEISKRQKEIEKHLKEIGKLRQSIKLVNDVYDEEEAYETI